MPETTTGKSKNYKVLTIDEMQGVAKAGGIKRYYRHRIETKEGTILTVDVDEADFTPEKADKILTAKADNADKIKTQ